jgi:hypothetical protein
MPRIVLNGRSLTLLVAGVVILTVGVLQAKRLAADHELLKPYDFVQYWSAGRQVLDGLDPYDPDQLITIQREMFAGHRKTVMMWNPPWTLPLTLPFAALPWRLAQFLWLGLQLAAVLISADLLWRIYGGAWRLRWVSWLIALTFAPTLFLLLLGQISGLLLLGLTGFLYFLRKDRPTPAGCCAALTAIKPHLLPLFGLTLILEATHRNSTRRVLVTGGSVLFVCALLPLLWNPHVWAQYFAAMRRPPSEVMETMQQFEHPTLGYELRLLLPGEQNSTDDRGPFWAQFIPAAAALLVTIMYWLSRRRSWQWERAIPFLVLFSVLTAAYGAWAFDLVVLLAAIIPMTIWLLESGTKPLVAAVGGLYLLLNGLELLTIRDKGSQSNAWITPVVFGAYIAVSLWRRWNKHLGK